MISDEIIADCAYLISRGIRPLATLGTVDADPLLMLQTITRIESISFPYNVLPFVLDRGDGLAECGIAAEGWALDLYRWSLTVPEPQRARIQGLLHGYSVEAIGHYEQRRAYSGRCFQSPVSDCTSAELESK